MSTGLLNPTGGVHISSLKIQTRCVILKFCRKRNKFDKDVNFTANLRGNLLQCALVARRIFILILNGTAAQNTSISYLLHSDFPVSFRKRKITYDTEVFNATTALSFISYTLINSNRYYSVIYSKILGQYGQP
jgi:hypothetical protein